MPLIALIFLGGHTDQGQRGGEAISHKDGTNVMLKSPRRLRLERLILELM